MPEIVMEQRFAAPPERVFAAMTDHEAFGRLLGEDIRVERPGTPPPNGLGAVRLIRARGLAIREEVVRWEEPRAMDYRVISGAPFRSHLGEIRVAPEGSGSRLDYRIRFEWPWWAGGAVVGGLLAGMLRRQIAEGIARLASTLR